MDFLFLVSGYYFLANVCVTAVAMSRVMPELSQDTAWYPWDSLYLGLFCAAAAIPMLLYFTLEERYLDWMGK